MRLRLRPILALLTSAAIMFGLAGCGGADESLPSDPSEASGKITMWIYPIREDLEKTWWPQRVAEFTKKYPKVDVQVVVQPWENKDEKLTTAIAGNKGPDVVYLLPDQVSQYAATGALADVSDVVGDDRSDFRPNTLAALTSQNKLYGVPLLMSVTTTMVNKKAMAAAGITEIPKTWDDVLAAAPKLKAKGYFTTQYAADAAQTLNQTFYPLLWQAGGEVLSADGKKAAFNSPAGVQALEFAKKLVDGGYAPKEALTTAMPPEPGKLETSPWTQGKVGMTLFTPSPELSTYHLDRDDFEIGAPLKQARSVSYGTVGGLSVLDSSKNKGAAKAWVKWVTSTAEMKNFNKSHSYFAPRKSVGALYTGDPLAGEEEKYLDLMRPGVISSQSRALMDLIKPHLQAALLGKVAPKQALDDAAKEVNALIARG